jgi:hypothetical protein
MRVDDKKCEVEDWNEGKNDTKVVTANRNIDKTMDMKFSPSMSGLRHECMTDTTMPSNSSLLERYDGGR